MRQQDMGKRFSNDVNIGVLGISIKDSEYCNMFHRFQGSHILRIKSDMAHFADYISYLMV